MYTDTHCHLYINHYDADRDQVIRRAVDSGISRMLVPGLDVPTSLESIALSDAYPAVFAAVGVHPNSADTWNDDSIHSLRTLSRKPKVVAIGEIGLDYYWNRSPHDWQKKILKIQLGIAAEAGLPVVIHNRDSTEDVVDILLTWQEELVAIESPLALRPGVVHSYSGDLKSAGELVDRNFFIGITGPVTFKKADELRTLVADIPLEKLLIETDAPYLTPHPFRGKRNEPSYVRFVAEKIAEVRGVSPESIAQATTRNADRLFGWGETLDETS